MNNLNTVLPNGTFGVAVSLINANFSLIVNAINSLEYASTKSKGIHNYGFVPSTTTIPNAVSGDWCMVLREGNTFPADIWTYNGTSWSKGGTWNPEGLDLTDYASKTELTTAIADSLAKATARMGYGVATASGNDYSVTIADFTLPTYGGNIRVKMPSAATGAATLKIGDTDAKTLWYNGAAVSSQNTWAAEEIISVFYDGTKYMASNSQGGGGMAERIKYDKSQSGLAATNVQAALDEVSIYNISNASGTTVNGYYIDAGNNKWIQSSTGYYQIFKMFVGDKVRITSNANIGYAIAFLASSTPEKNQTASFANGYNGVIVAEAGESGVYLITEDCFLYVLGRSSSSANPRTPDKVEMITRKDYSDITLTESDMAEKKCYINANTLRWVESQYAIAYFYNLNKGDYVHIISNPSHNPAVYALFKGGIEYGELVNFASGTSSTIMQTIGHGGIIATEDCTLYVLYSADTRVQGNFRWPSSITLIRTNYLPNKPIDSLPQKDSEGLVKSGGMYNILYGVEGEEITETPALEQGGFNGSGEPTTANIRVRFKEFVKVNGEFSLNINSGFAYNCFMYTKPYTSAYKRQIGAWKEGEYNDDFVGYIRVGVKNASDASADVLPSQVVVTLTHKSKTNGIADDVEEIEKKLSDTGSYVWNADMIRRTVNTEYVGTMKYPQAFCVYNGHYYSTNGTNIAEQDESFNVLRDVSLNLGHGNALQLGENGIAWGSGWDDNKLYKVNLSTLTISETKTLPVSGYTTVAVDERNSIAYIFQRTTYPSTVEPWNFIVWDFANNEIKSTRIIESFAGMQACDYYQGKIYMVSGFGSAATPSEMRVYNTAGDVLAFYKLDVLSSVEPEGICVDRDSNLLLFSNVLCQVYKVLN